MNQDKNNEKLFNETISLREKTWASWGIVDPDALTFLINPSMTGGPRWPSTRQAFRTARRNKLLLLASDGLSDPWSENGNRTENGFGLEFFAISSEIKDVHDSWLWDVVFGISQFAAKRGDIASLIDEMMFLSTVLYDIKIPEKYRARFISGDEQLGIMLGLTDSSIPSIINGPCSDIRLINVKVLTTSELNYVLDNGEEGRNDLANRFAATSSLISDLNRDSVI